MLHACGTTRVDRCSLVDPTVAVISDGHTREPFRPLQAGLVVDFDEKMAVLCADDGQPVRKNSRPVQVASERLLILAVSLNWAKVRLQERPKFCRRPEL